MIFFLEVTKPKRKNIEEEEVEEESEEEEEEEEGENYTNLNAVRTAALDKLMVLTEKYGRKQQDLDFDDFDIGELDIISDDDDE